MESALPLGVAARLLEEQRLRRWAQPSRWGAGGPGRRPASPLAHAPVLPDELAEIAAALEGLPPGPRRLEAPAQVFIPDVPVSEAFSDWSIQIEIEVDIDDELLGDVLVEETFVDAL